MSSMESSGENAGQSKEIGQEIAPVNLRLIMRDPGKDNQRRARMEHETERLASLVQSDQPVVVDSSRLYQLTQEVGYERVKVTGYGEADEVQAVDLRQARIDPGSRRYMIDRQDWEIEKIRRASRGGVKVIVDSNELYVALNRAKYVPNLPIDWSALEREASVSHKLARYILRSVVKFVRNLPERD